MPVFKKLTRRNGNAVHVNLDRILWLEEGDEHGGDNTQMIFDEGGGLKVKESIEEITGQAAPAADLLVAIGVTAELGNPILTWSVTITSRGDALRNREAAFEALCAAADDVSPEKIMLIGVIDGKPTMVDDFNSVIPPGFAKPGSPQ